jgi:hypothetical protein
VKWTGTQVSRVPAVAYRSRLHSAKASPMNVFVAKFRSLSRTDKAVFLARVAHEATICARMSYVPTPAHPNRDYDHPDAVILRDANNFVHRVVGYIPHVLKGTIGRGRKGRRHDRTHDPSSTSKKTLDQWAPSRHDSALN